MKRPTVTRDGPGLIGSMAESAVLCGWPSLQRPGRPTASGRASARYSQLCELLEAGILTEVEFNAAIGRVTAQLATESGAAGDATHH